MEEKKEKRGRPATGQKKYKNITFRIEESEFLALEELAQEKSSVSIHTYVKNNLGKLFDKKETAEKLDKVLFGENEIYYKPNEEQEKELKKVFDGNVKEANLFLKKTIVENFKELYIQEYFIRTIDIHTQIDVLRHLETEISISEFQKNFSDLKQLTEIYFNQKKSFENLKNFIIAKNESSLEMNIKNILNDKEYNNLKLIDGKIESGYADIIINLESHGYHTNDLSMGTFLWGNSDFFDFLNLYGENFKEFLNGTPEVIKQEISEYKNLRLEQLKTELRVEEKKSSVTKVAKNKLIF